MTMAPAAPPSLDAPPPDATPAPPRESLLTRLKLLLRPKNFIAAVPGPIFHRDVWISGRKSGTYWIRCIYVLLLAGVIALTFAGASDELRSAASPSLRLQSLQTVAPIATKVILWFQLGALAFAGAIFGAPAICEEKRAGTLATLLTTPLKAWQIVMGKTFAFFVQLLILTLAAAPLLLAVRVFGGVSATEIVAGTVLSLATALFAGMCALWHSIKAKRTTNAMSAGFTQLLFVMGIVPLGWIIYAWKFNVPPPFEFLTYCSTPAAMACVTFGFEFGAADAVRNAWIFSTLYTLGWCALMFVASSIRLRAVMAREGAGGSIIPKGKKVKKPRKVKGAPPVADQPAVYAAAASAIAGTPTPTSDDTFTPPDIKHKRRASSVQEGVTRTVSDHPVLWREVRQAHFRTRFRMYAALAIAAAAMCTIYYYAGLDGEELHFPVGIIGILLVLLTGAISPSAVISGEREARTWEVLLTTPLSAWSIIIGKAAGALRRQWYIPLILGVHFVLAVLAGFYYDHRTISPAILLWVPLILLPPLIFLTATGALLSMACKKSATAAAANFGVALLLWAIIPGVTAFTLFAILNANDAGEDFFSIFMVLNPVALMALALEGAMDRSYSLFDIDAGLIGFVAAVIIYAGLYLGAAYLVLKAAAGILAAKTLRLK
ncbi:MAG TPA: ABC transporter permease subunit [Phycisphaerales bacterium]|nr:ABC transporter permease subunit [Phycisphaerales bacterium]